MEVLGGAKRKQYRLVVGQQLEPFVKDNEVGLVLVGDHP